MNSPVSALNVNKVKGHI